MARNFLHVATASRNCHELVLRNIFRSDLPFVRSSILPMHKETRQTVARAPEGRCPWRGEWVYSGARDTDLSHPCLMDMHVAGMLRETFRINTDLHVTLRIICRIPQFPSYATGTSSLQCKSHSHATGISSHQCDSYSYATVNSPDQRNSYSYVTRISSHQCNSYSYATGFC